MSSRVPYHIALVILFALFTLTAFEHSTARLDEGRVKRHSKTFFQVKRASETIAQAEKLGGSITAMAKQGQHVYLGWGAQIIILDVSALETDGPPVLAGSTPVLPGIIANMVVQGNYLYLACYQAGLRIWDITQPTSPTDVGVYLPENGAQARFVRVQGDFAYLLQDDDNLVILDVENRADPVRLSSMPTHSHSSAFTLAGNYLYMGQGGYQKDAKLITWDIANKWTPTEVGCLPFAENMNFRNIVIEGDTLYVQSMINGLFFVNVGDPTQPVLRGKYLSPTNAAGGNGAALAGNYLLVTQGGGGVEFVDITNLEAAQQINSITPEGSSSEILIEGEYAFILGDYFGLSILDIADPFNPAIDAVYRVQPVGEVMAVAQQGAYLYMADVMGLNIVDINATTLNPVGSYPPLGEGPHEPLYGLDVLAYQDYVYLGRCDQIQIINIHDATAPFVVGSIPLPSDGYFEMAIQDNWLFILNHNESQQHQEIILLDITVPQDPGFVSTYTIDHNGHARKFAVTDQWVYYLDYESFDMPGIYIVDYSNPAQPQEIGVIPYFDDYLMDIALTDQFAYIAAPRQIEIYDLSDKTNPQWVARFATPGVPNSLAIRGDALYAATPYRILAWDIATGTNPRLINEFRTPDSYAASFVVTDTALIMANHQAGLVKIPLQSGIAPLNSIYLPILIQ